MAMVLQQMMELIYAILTILLKYMKKAEIFTVYLKKCESQNHRLLSTRQNSSCLFAWQKYTTYRRYTEI